MGTGGWFGLVAPAGTPQDVIDTLNQAVKKAAANPEFQERAKKAGGTLITNSPEEFAEQIDAALDRYAKVVKAANIQAN
jgi:tripartite-type tricarboxylate transporter receptor subunit TctC